MVELDGTMQGDGAIEYGVVIEDDDAMTSANGAGVERSSRE